MINRAIFLDFYIYFYVLYSTLLHLPPLRLQCVGGCWDRTQDSGNSGIGSQTLLHCKNMLAVFPSPAGMPLPKLSLDGNNFPVQESLVSGIPAGDGKTAIFFLQCTTRLDFILFQSMISLVTYHCRDVYKLF
jgi:hypothetical protein